MARHVDRNLLPPDVREKAEWQAAGAAEEPARTLGEPAQAE